MKHTVPWSWIPWHSDRQKHRIFHSKWDDRNFQPSSFSTIEQILLDKQHRGRSYCKRRQYLASCGPTLHGSRVFHGKMVHFLKVNKNKNDFMKTLFRPKSNVIFSGFLPYYIVEWRTKLKYDRALGEPSPITQYTFLSKIQNRISKKTRKKIVLLSWKILSKHNFWE